MTHPITSKQRMAIETIATHTILPEKKVSINMNSLMGSVEATNIVSTRAILAGLQIKGLIVVLTDLKNESVDIELSQEGATFLKSLNGFSQSSLNLDRVIAGKEIELPLEEEQEQEKELPLEQILDVISTNVEKVKEIVKEKGKRSTNIKAESKDEDGNFCPKKGDLEGGSKSWNIYQFLRMRDQDGNAPSNNLIANRMANLGGFHTVYYSEIQRIKDNYNITLKD